MLDIFYFSMYFAHPNFWNAIITCGDKFSLQWEKLQP